MCVCVCVCVCASVRACVRACVCMCVCKKDWRRTSFVDIGMCFCFYVVGSCHLNFNFRKIYWVIIVNLLRVANEYSVWPDGTLQCTMKSENSVWLSRTLLFGEISDTIFWLQDSSYRSSSYPVIELSSVDIRLASTINHLSITSSLFFTAMSMLATGLRLLSVGTAPVWCCGGASWLRCYSLWRLPTPFTVSCCWHGAARDDLVSSATCLCHHWQGLWLLSRLYFVD